MKPQSKTHLRLAQTFYLARLKELKSEVETYENRFTVLMGEINAVKSGNMDDAIKEEIKAGLIRKHGKKLLDWLPNEKEIMDAVEAGPIKDGEVDLAKETTVEEQPVMEKANEAVDIAAAQTASVEEKADEPIMEDAAVATTKSAKIEQVEEPRPKSRGKKETRAKEVKEISPIKDKHAKKGSQPETATPTEVEPAASAPVGPAEETVEPVLASEERRKSTDRPSARSTRRKGSEPAATAPKTPAAISPASDLSPVPATQSESKPEPTTPAAGPSSPTPNTAIRTSKRKASAQPRGVPASKRSGTNRRGTSPTHTHSEAATDHEGDGDVQMANADAENEQESTVEEGGRGRRSSKRHTKAHDTPPPTSRHKESSPAVSRRAQSVSSNASTPQAIEEKRPRRGKNRGMRDEVVSKSVREQSAAVESVKEEDDEAESPPKSPAEDSRPSRTSARRGKKETTPIEDKKESATPATVRKTRSAKSESQKLNYTRLKNHE